MNQPGTQTLVTIPAGPGLPARFALIALVLSVETVLLSYLIQGTPVVEAVGLAKLVHTAQHWVFRFMIAYAASLAILVYTGRDRRFAESNAAAAGAPVRWQFAVLHLVLLIPFALFSANLYSRTTGIPFAVLALGWHASAAGCAAALFLCLAPWPLWIRTLRQAGAMLLFAIAPALGAVLTIQWSQQLWRPAAQVSFRLVELMLRPLVPNLHVDSVALSFATPRFAVVVSDACSGLEGMGLMLIFCSAWLWYFRREFRFPRALSIICLLYTSPSPRD